MRKIVDRLFDGLTPLLQECGLDDAQIAVVHDDVQHRLQSVLSRWNDIEFRRTVLLLGTEEALFYEPSWVNLKIRSLVVVAVRNSLLEDFASKAAAAQAHGAEAPLISDAFMPKITATAARVLAALVRDPVDIDPVLPEHDVFGTLPNRFPVAWRALTELASISGGEKRYKPIEATKPDALNADQTLSLSVDEQYTQLPTVTLSGMDRTIDPELQRVLQAVHAGEADVAIFPSWRSCTRNPEKLLEVLDYVLSCGATFLTLNYYLTNGHVAARSGLIRPPRSVSQIADELQNHEGLTSVHEEAMRVASDAHHARTPQSTTDFPKDRP